MLVVGFLVLSLSSFELNSGMGLLTAIVISFALLADFLLLPPILMLFDKGHHAGPDKKPLSEKTAKEHAHA